MSSSYIPATNSPSPTEVATPSPSPRQPQFESPPRAADASILASAPDDDDEIPVEDFPRSLSPSQRITIIVPKPHEAVPIWTENIAVFFNSPRSFTSMMKLPDPQVDPAFYAAACDVIRSSNWRLDAHGPYRQSLQKSHLKQLKRNWRQSYPDEAKYPFPADPRVLFVKLNDAHPLDEDEGVRNTTWARACEEFDRVKGDTFTKSSLLRKTRDDHIRENKMEGQGVEGEDKLQVRMYVRYLVWREHSAAKKARTTDTQPSRRELEAYFNKAEVKKNGATLANICHEFPDARDMQMLVYRIEQVATLTTRPSTNDHKNPVEAVYLPKETRPLHKGLVRAAVKEMFEDANVLPIEARTQIPASLMDYADTHRTSILEILQSMTKANRHGESFALLTYTGPSLADFYMGMGQVNGYTLDDLHVHFADHLFNYEEFMEPLVNLLYEDSTDGLFYSRFFEDGGLVRDEKRNKALRLRARVLQMLDNAPEAFGSLMDGVASWDAETEQFLPKAVPATAPAAPSTPSKKRSRDEETVEAGPSSPKRPRTEEAQPAEQDTREEKKQCRGLTRQKKRCKLQGRCLVREDYYCSKHRKN
ncbi:hypothetical protein IAQ61_011262 [Plenodomus lingam]|uniref:Predicted protein n=1 Tax=Leptosphaeria maculans (strain JN3 / isolate v23.1.3 / race Av1-4-5-6-7-8) TaxID=985895 RepID=E5A9J1_LEPMJ|nr:predicted protein [Plenodomus lingam JN3]KAH9859481.1 hypothetical protein IAQ61_011262 [Plenodomus lingam]CBY00332.1 predicted protein [Plenodomus lingam JN3]